MFWKILAGAARAAMFVNKTVTGVGAAIVIAVSVNDYLKRRRK